MFYSANSPEKMITFDDYITSMNENQKHIYYIAGDNMDILKTSPFLDRFKLKHFMRPYSVDDLSELLSLNCKKLDVNMSEEAIRIIAKASRGTPRIANNFLEWVRDYKIAYNINGLQKQEVTQALEMQGIDENGLNPVDRDYLAVLEKLPKGSAVGVNTLCSALNIDRQTIEQKIEPFLIRQGYVAKTSKGRILTK